ncbi:MAG: molybdate ABC transporter permease subunit [Pseudomonadales bacterium]
MNPDLTAIILTLKLATITTVILILVGTPLAWWLAHSQHRLRSVAEAFIALPLVLPPTVIGFYLLIVFAPSSLPGQWWQGLTGTQLAFSFSALVIGSVIYSLPFAVQPLKNTFAQLPHNLLEAAATMGCNRWDRIRNIIFPLSKRGFITAATLGFAHTVGEFGIVLMIGGNIPGETQVLSIALYDKVETLDYSGAHWLAAGLVIFSLIVLSALYASQRNTREGSLWG